MTLMRLKGIAMMALQETKLSDKDAETIGKENPRLVIESNSNDRKSGTAFIINKDIIKWNTAEDKPWKHEIIERGRMKKPRYLRN